jgi:phosphate transport system permease protein
MSNPALTHHPIPFPTAKSKSFPHLGDSRDTIATVVVWSIALLVVAAFFCIVGNLIWRGLSGITWGFLTTAPRDAGRQGGILPIIASTLLILLVCLVVSVPVGIASAIWLTEFAPFDSGVGKLVRRCLDVLAGVPSIVFGLFGNVLFCRVLGMGFSILSGGLTLACMVLPILARSTEQGFRSVPDDYRNAAAALGLSRVSTVIQIILPVAAPGLVVGLVLGIARALAETAALIFTSGYVDRMPISLFDSGRALSVHIFDLSLNVPGGDKNACASALFLVFLLLLINLLASWGSDRWLHSRIIRG